MQIVVLNGPLSEAEQDEYIRHMEKKYPISCSWMYMRGMWMLAAPSIVSVIFGRWAAAVLGNHLTGTPQSRQNYMIQSPMRLIFEEYYGTENLYRRRFEVILRERRVCRTRP